MGGSRNAKHFGGEETSPEVATALRPRLDAIRAQMAPYEKRLRSATALNAAEWARGEVLLGQIREELRFVLWEARLEALQADL